MRGSSGMARGSGRPNVKLRSVYDPGLAAVALARPYGVYYLWDQTAEMPLLHGLTGSLPAPRLRGFRLCPRRFGLGEYKIGQDQSDNAVQEKVPWTYT